MMIRKIARRSREILGRTAIRSTKQIDWDAAFAVRSAAREFGLDQPLAQWVRPEDASLTAIARSFVARYVQAYGPVGDMIDIGAHIGNPEPQIVTISG